VCKLLLTGSLEDFSQNLKPSLAFQPDDHNRGKTPEEILHVITSVTDAKVVLSTFFKMFS